MLIWYYYDMRHCTWRIVGETVEEMEARAARSFSTHIVIGMEAYAPESTWDREKMWKQCYSFIYTTIHYIIYIYTLYIYTLYIYTIVYYTTSILKGFNRSKILKMSLEVQISNLRLFWVFPLLTTAKNLQLRETPMSGNIIYGFIFFFPVTVPNYMPWN